MLAGEQFIFDGAFAAVRKMPARETGDACGEEAPASSSSSPPSPPVPNNPGVVESAAGTETDKDSAGGTMTGGGKALIHPQRHNLKNRFELMKTLGEGTYGKVKLASEKATGEQVAIKYVKKTKIQDEMDLNRIRREIRILTSLRHPHIVNIRQVFEKKDRIVLVMDYAEGGELYDYLNSQRCLPEAETRRIFRQIVAAVHYVHQNGIVHRDLKLENIILDTDRNVKIADFGLANYFSKNSSLNTFCGSPLYASPEIVNGQPYKGPEVDVWSLGVVLYTLAYGAMPFESGNLKVLRQQISTGQYAEPAQPCGASGLIRHMLTVNSARRATMPEVLNHWWVNLGYDLTPDGRQENLMSLPLNRSSHRQHGAGSPSVSDTEAEVKPPSASLRHVPGARSGRRTAEETSLVQDDEMPQENGTCGASCVTGQDDVDAGQNSEDAFQRGDGVCHESEASQRSADGSSQVEAGSRHADAELSAGDNPNLPWSQVLANSIREIRDRVIKSLATEEASSETLDMEQGEADVAQSMDKVRSTPNLLQVEEEALAASGDKRHSLDSDKAFDSDRKPRRGILKRKGKFSGDDYSCCMMVDDSGICPKNIKSAPKNSARPRDLPLTENFFCHPAMPNVSAQSLVKSPAKPAIVPAPAPATAVTAPKQQACPVHHCHSTPTSTATTPNSVDSAEKWASPPPVHDDLSKTQPVPADLNFPEIPPVVEGSSSASSSVTSQSPSGSDLCCTCSTDVTKVVRRRKGILKNGGSSNRNSLIDDARKRLSMGSQSSNSSADILDLSYDSADGEQMVCKSRSMDSQDMICRSQSSDSQDLICRSRSAGCENTVCKSRSTDGEDMLRQPRSKENDFVTSKPRCDQSSSVQPQSSEARDCVHPPLPNTASDHTICKSQSVEENVIHRFRSSDLQKALSELSMSCSRRKRYQHSYSFQPGDRGSFSLEGEFTALNLADMSAALMPHPSPLCDDAMFDYSEARHVLQQALQFAN